LDTDSETEADLAVPVKEQLARAKARSAFLRLVRRGLALASLAVVLHQQAFMVRRRQKVVPLHVAVSGAVAWAGDYAPGDGGTGGGGDSDGDSGGWGAWSSLRSGDASWPGAVHAASRSLLTPLEYMQGSSTRAAAGDSTQRRLSAAYAKTERKLRKIVDTNSSLAAQMAAAPMPNAPALGAYLLTGGGAASLFLPGAEGLVLLGCGCLWLGCDGMHGTPELMAVCCLAALGLYVGRSSRATAAAPKRRRRRAAPSPREDEREDEHGHSHDHAAGRACCEPEPPRPVHVHDHGHGHGHGGRSCCD
jgi:hypothetical protein